jgi:hypothetical protein
VFPLSVMCTLNRMPCLLFLSHPGDFPLNAIHDGRLVLTQPSTILIASLPTGGVNPVAPGSSCLVVDSILTFTRVTTTCILGKTISTSGKHAT